MKLKNVLLTLGLALGVGAAVGAGFCIEKPAIEANAANDTIETHPMYVAINTSTVTSDAYSDFNLRINCNIGDGGTWKQTKMTQTSDTSTFAGKTVFVGTFTEKYGGVDALQIQIYDGDTWKSQTIVYSGWTLMSSFGGNLYKYEEKAWVSGYTSPLENYTVTKLAVEFVDGVAQAAADWGLGSDSVLEGASHATPGSVVKNWEHFDGWYTDAACTYEYEGTESMSSSSTIYAKFIRLSLDSYFYWCDKDSSDITDGYVYFWGEYQTNYSEISIKDYQVSVISLEGQGNIYKIPVPSIGNVHCLLHNSTDNVKTIDINEIVRGAVYYTWFKDNGDDGKSYYNYDANTGEGPAADFLAEFETYRNAVEASTGILEYSICGISPSNAAYLYGKYELLSPEVKGRVDRSCTKTYVGKYDGVNTPEESQIYFSAIMDEIYTIALKDNTFAANHLSSRFSPTFNDADNSALIIAVTAFAAILATGGFFFLRRRKEN